MRILSPCHRLSLSAACGAVVLGVAGPSLAAAQSRTAAITVSATVRDITETDMIGAHPMAVGLEDDALVANFESGSWRISSGRSPEVGLQLETADEPNGEALVSYVTICDDAAEARADCARHQAPLLRMSAEGALREFVVRVGRGPSARRTTPVRLTLAFLAY